MDAAAGRRLLLGRVLWALVVLLSPRAPLAAVLAPYTAYVDRAAACDASDPSSTDEILMHLDASSYDVRKPNVLQRVTFNMTVGVKGGVNDAQWIRARIDSRTHSHWADNAFTFNFPDKACQHFRTHWPGVYSTLTKQDPESRKPCRMPPGLYEADNVPVNWTFPKFPVFPLGTWTFTVTVGEGKATFFCHKLFARTVRKH